jgi:hypothetical protein
MGGPPSKTIRAGLSVSNLGDRRRSFIIAASMFLKCDCARIAYVFGESNSGRSPALIKAFCSEVQRKAAERPPFSDGKMMTGNVFVV